MIAKQLKHDISLDSLIEAFRWALSEHSVLNFHFRIFDKTETGLITTEELGRAMSRFGENMKSSELRDMIREADCEGDGTVDYRSESLKYISSSQLGYAEFSKSLLGKDEERKKGSKSRQNISFNKYL